VELISFVTRIHSETTVDFNDVGCDATIETQQTRRWGRQGEVVYGDEVVVGSVLELSSTEVRGVRVRDPEVSPSRLRSISSRHSIHTGRPILQSTECTTTMMVRSLPALASIDVLCEYILPSRISQNRSS
jgi:hypothetical protein